VVVRLVDDAAVDGDVVTGDAICCVVRYVVFAVVSVGVGVCAHVGVRGLCCYACHCWQW